MSALTDGDLERLRKIPSFCWAFVGDSLQQKLFSVIDENRMLASQLQEAASRQREIMAATEQRLQDEIRAERARLDAVQISLGDCLFRANKIPEAIMHYEQARLDIVLVFHLMRMYKDSDSVIPTIVETLRAEQTVLSRLMLAMMQIKGIGISKNAEEGAAAIQELLGQTDSDQDIYFYLAWNASEKKAIDFFDQAVKKLGHMEFPMRGSCSRGILSFCMSIFGEDLLSGKGVPVVTCPGVMRGKVASVLKGNTTAEWASKPDVKAHSQIVFDFVDRKVNPTGFMIQMGSTGWRSWEIHGSNVADDWGEPLDSYSDETVMCEKNKGQCFGYRVRKQSEAFRYLMLRFTAVNSASNWSMTSQGMEIYGTLC
jgi:hypothetical protein